MEKIRNSGVLKIICYILIPILVAMLGFSIVHVAFLNEYGNVENETEYIESEQFANNYFYSITDIVSQVKYEENGDTGTFIEVEDNNGNKFYYTDIRRTNNYYSGMKYIIVNKKTNKMYTNIKSENYSHEMEKMKSNQIYWNLVDGEIETSLKEINSGNIKYNYSYVYQIKETPSYSNSDYILKNYDIYTYYDENNLNEYTEHGIYKTAYEYMLKHKEEPIYVISITILSLVIIAIYLFWSIGHESGEKISLNTIDDIPYEILTIICFSILYIFFTLLVNVFTSINYIMILLGIVCYFVCYSACAIMGVTTIKRIKAKKFLNSFFTYKMARWFYRKVKKFVNIILENTTNSKKLFWSYIIFIIISIILGMFFATGIAVLMLIAFWIWVYYQIKNIWLNKKK